MNIDQVKVEQKTFATTFGYWDDIFNHQQALMDKYHKIEVSNGFAVTESKSLDNPFLQHRVKDFFWRATEEFAEALEFETGMGEVRDPTRHMNSNTRHTLEELSDVLHFLTEASIVSNQINPTHVDDAWHKARGDLFGQTQSGGIPWISFQAECWAVVQQMGLAANCLKNKPWKVTQVETNAAKFEQHFYQAWVKLLSVLKSLGLDIRSVHLLYIQKNHVNQFRQASKY